MKTPLAVSLLGLIVVGVLLIYRTQRQHQASDYEAAVHCRAVLNGIYITKNVCAQDRNLTNGAVVSWDDIYHYSGRSNFICLRGGRYSLNPIGRNASCSYTGVAVVPDRRTPHDSNRVIVLKHQLLMEVDDDLNQ